jgi:hypothetical protein
MSASAIKGTMDAMSSAGRVVSGIAAAGKSVVDQVAASADTRRIDSRPASSKTTPESAAPEPPRVTPPREESEPGSA